MNAKIAAKVRFKTKKEHHRARTARLEPGAKKCRSQTSRPAPIAAQARTPLQREPQASTRVRIVHQVSTAPSKEQSAWMSRARAAMSIHIHPQVAQMLVLFVHSDARHHKAASLARHAQQELFVLILPE